VTARPSSPRTTRAAGATGTTSLSARATRPTGTRLTGALATRRRAREDRLGTSGASRRTLHPRRHECLPRRRRWRRGSRGFDRLGRGRGRRCCFGDRCRGFLGSGSLDFRLGRKRRKITEEHASALFDRRHRRRDHRIRREDRRHLLTLHRECFFRRNARCFRISGRLGLRDLGRGATAAGGASGFGRRRFRLGGHSLHRLSAGRLLGGGGFSLAALLALPADPDRGHLGVLQAGGRAARAHAHVAEQRHQLVRADPEFFGEILDFRLDHSILRPDC
jgi:hypothetical protein